MQQTKQNSTIEAKNKIEKTKKKLKIKNYSLFSSAPR